MDDSVDDLERALRRRKLLGRGMYLAVIAGPLVIIGMCVRTLTRESPPSVVTFTPEEQSSIRNIRREMARGRGD
jgi:hypothetical protein